MLDLLYIHRRLSLSVPRLNALKRAPIKDCENNQTGDSSLNTGLLGQQ